METRALRHISSLLPGARAPTASYCLNSSSIELSNRSDLVAHYRSLTIICHQKSLSHCSHASLPELWIKSSLSLKGRSEIIASSAMLPICLRNCGNVLHSQADLLNSARRNTLSWRVKLCSVEKQTQRSGLRTFTFFITVYLLMTWIKSLRFNAVNRPPLSYSSLSMQVCSIIHISHHSSIEPWKDTCADGVMAAWQGFIYVKAQDPQTFPLSYIPLRLASATWAACSAWYCSKYICSSYPLRVAA